MIFFLFGLMTTYIQIEKTKNNEKTNEELKQEYFEMMTSYVIYANYINLCCGVQMEPTWNIKIGNLYVYDYKIKNVPTTANLELDLTPMIDITLACFAEELSHIGLNDKVNIKQFWDKLDDRYKTPLIEKYSSSYLKDITGENIINNLDKILYYIRKNKINKLEMHLIIQLLKDLEVDSSDIKKYRMLVIDTYNAKTKIEYSPIEPPQISFDGYKPFSTEMIEYINNFKTIHLLLIDYIDKDENTEESFQNLVQKIHEFKINENKNKLLELLLIVNNIALYHFRNADFFEKIEQIINCFKEDIQNLLNTFDIINIFGDNPMIYNYLINEKLIPFDKDVYNSCMFSEYKQYFSKKCLKFVKENTVFSALDEQSLNRVGNDGNFDEKQKKGENETDICQLIRNDSIDDFIGFINQNHIPPKYYIKESIFETNPMLKDNNVSLIKYAAFFGAVKIFKYIHTERKVKLNPSIWEFAIHGRNLEIIQIIEENEVYFDTSNIKLIEVLVQCHDNDIYNYFINNYYTDNNQTIESYKYEFPLKYRNYILISNKMPDNNKFLLRCIYEYNLYEILKSSLKTSTIELNKQMWKKYAVIYSNVDIIKLALNDDKHHYNGNSPTPQPTSLFISLEGLSLEQQQQVQQQVQQLISSFKNPQ